MILSEKKAFHVDNRHVLLEQASEGENWIWMVGVVKSLEFNVYKGSRMQEYREFYSWLPKYEIFYDSSQIKIHTTQRKKNIFFPIKVIDSVGVNFVPTCDVEISTKDNPLRT